MRASKYLAFIFLVACSQTGSDQASPEESATFTVDPVTAVAEDGQANSTFSNVPTSRLINFTACVKDVAMQQPITGAEFSVTDGSKVFNLKSPSPDAKGCLYWSENFPFTATDQEKFFEVNRIIEATSMHKGRATIRIAVNPWKKGAGGVMDLRYQSAPVSNGQATGTTGLVIDTVEANLEITKSKDAVADAKLRLSFSPKIFRAGIDGSPIPEPLTGGRFALRTQIIALTAEGEVPLTSVAEFKDSRIERGSVQLNAQVKVLRKIPREATIELSLEAIPLDAPEALKPVRGRVPLGRFTSLSISKTAPLRPEAQVSFTVQDSVSGKEEGGDLFGFEFGRLRAENVVVKSIDSTGKPNMLLVDFVVCLRNSLSQEKILGQKFSVTLDGKRFPELKTNEEDGCLKWVGQPFKFDYHAKESFLKRTLTVKSENPYYGDAKTDRTVHLNLWNYLTPGQIVTDEKYDGVPLPSVADQGSGSELVYDQAWFNYMGRTFEIDAHLNLTTIRSYIFQMTPKIRRMSRARGWLPSEGIGNGRFRVRILLETVDENNPHVIDAQTLTIESEADGLTSKVDFRIDDLRYVNIRTRVSIEVLPLDRSVSIRSKPYWGTFDMLGGFAVRMQPRNGSIEERMKQVSHKNPALRRTGAEIFREANKHESLDGDKLASFGISPGEFDSLVANITPSKASQPATIAASDSTALAKLCGQYFDSKGWFSGYSRCARDPSSWLAVIPVEFVRSVKQAKLARQPDSIDLGMSAGVNYSESSSEDWSHGTSQSESISTDIGIGLPLQGITGLKVGVGVSTNDSWSRSHGFSKGNSQSKSRSGDAGKKVTADEVEFKISANIDRCVLITEKTDKPKKGTKVFMGCHSHPQAKVVNETYYFLYQNFSNSALLDVGSDLEDRPLLALIRGKGRFEIFKKYMQDPNMSLNLTKELPAPADVMREAENRYDGYFPGMLAK